MNRRILECKKKGFTLAELVLVCTVMVILTTFTVLGFSKYVEASSNNNIVSGLEDMNYALNNALTDFEYLYGDFKDLYSDTTIMNEVIFVSKESFGESDTTDDGYKKQFMSCLEDNLSDGYFVFGVTPSSLPREYYKIQYGYSCNGTVSETLEVRITDQSGNMFLNGELQ